MAESSPSSPDTAPKQILEPSTSSSAPVETDAMNGAPGKDNPSPLSPDSTAVEAEQAPSLPPKESSEPTADTNIDKETEKHENGSLSTTLTGTNATSRRKAHQSSASEEQPSSATHTKEKEPGSKRTIKPSFFSRFIRKMVPCIPSSPSSQPVEIDELHNDTSPPSKEKSGAPAPEHEPAGVSEPQADTATSSGTKEEADLPPLDMSPPPHTDSDIILPPTPTTHLLPQAETEGMTSGAVVPPGATGTVSKRHSHVPSTNGDDGEESEASSVTDEYVDDLNGADEIEDEEDRLIMNGGAGIPIGPDGNPKPLLPPISPNHLGRKCLVLDLDETLVHSSFKAIQNADFVVPVEIEYHWHNVYVIKRPGVDNFLKKMGEIYEVVVFTASLSKYADPVLDKLDIHRVVKHRLFRESCYNHRGNYVKDLSQLGRPIADSIIIDNSPASYIFHPNNAVPVSSWFNDPHDTELTDLVPFLDDLADVPDVRGVLDGAR